MADIIRPNIKQTIENIDFCEKCKKVFADDEEHTVLVYDRETHFENKGLCFKCKKIYQEYGLI